MGSKITSYNPDFGFNDFSQYEESERFKMHELELDTNKFRTFASDSEKIDSRAYLKHLTRSVLYKLIDLRSPLQKSYWNTFHCQSLLTQYEDNSVHARYCKNRFCIVCSRIKTAELINKYLPVIRSWKEPFFVTLTVPNVPESELQQTYKFMLKIFSKIRKKSQYDNLDIVGIRKYEVTYNSQRKDYHPHFHLIVENKSMANYIINHWLDYTYPKTSPDAQDARIADENSVIELFKYFTKVMSKDSSKIPAFALDTIFNQSRYTRTFQSFGFTLNPAATLSDEEKQNYQYMVQVAQWEWIHELRTWCNTATGELLTDGVDEHTKAI